MLMLNQLTEEQRLTKAVVSIMSNPKYTALAGVLMIGERNIVDDPNIPTACTNGRDEMYARGFVSSLNDAELRFLVLHEVYHKLFKHLTTWKHLYDQDPQLANMACDYVINLKIVDDNDNDKFATMTGVLEGGCYDTKYRGMDSAQVFNLLKDNPHLMASFEDVKDPDENPYIFHPKQQRAAFVTPRSLEAASDILKTRSGMDDMTLTAALMGTIGDRGAMDLMAFVSLSDQLPSLQSIKDDPNNAKVPSSAAAVCMVVYRTLAALDKDWLNAWMDYLPRLDTEAQAMFANGVRSPKYSKQSMVMTNKKFTQWAMQNNHLYTADKV